MHPVSGSNREAKPVRGLRIRIAIATLCLPVHACDLGNGGAVELSWSLRPASSAGTQKFVGCQPDPLSGDQYDGWGPIVGIRLHWQVGSATCSRAWSCVSNHGATGFELPSGIANLWLTPECGAGPDTCDDDQPAAHDTYIAPAIVQREVMRGEVVSLGAIELVVAVTGCATAGIASDNRGTHACICPTGAQLATDHTSR